MIIGATLLHDIAMHLRSGGFRELVSKDSCFQPLPWFKDSHEGHSADRRWNDLWEDYLREARRFSDRDLTNIIGEESARVWKFQDLPQDSGQWEINDSLIVGEFVRRHHARLAHEIAIYGFPGLAVGSGEGQFSAMGKEEGHPLMRLADLIGLTARSHGTSLRVCKAYLESSPRYAGTPKPMGTAVLYPMVLLRVADYLQIDRQRAPAVLLQLRNPQSPISVQEWKKHRAVQNIGPATDPRGKMVAVSTDPGLSLYLQLRDLLAGLQQEMDHSTAVLDEAYGTLAELGLNQLNLASRRVYSNLQSPVFRDRLPYFPDRTGFTADPNLLTLLVEPLYGKAPEVGVRELMQNAVDAVCELEVWCTAHGKSLQTLDLPEQDCDVLIDFIERENGTWLLRVRDRGIGMKSETIQNYFLRAGASFRRSAEWAKDFLDEKGLPRVTRAGRFGIGAFAVFLLGPSFRLFTRHAGGDKFMGYTIEASANSQLIEIRRDNTLPIGTTIEVDISSAAVEGLKLDQTSTEYEGPSEKIDWFCWDWPRVVKRVIRGPEPEILAQEYSFAIRKPPPEWSVIHPKGFDAVYWTFSDAPKLVCNGLKITDPRPRYGDADFAWPDETQLRQPRISVVDREANVSLTTQRYKLANVNLPFIAELTRDVTLSFIAHALVHGPNSRAVACSLQNSHPLATEQIEMYDEYLSVAAFESGQLRWCATSTNVVPADPWFYSLLSAESCLVYGALVPDAFARELWSPTARWTEQRATTHFAMLPWHGVIEMPGYAKANRAERTVGVCAGILENLAREGVTALGHVVEASQVLFSAGSEFDFENHGHVLRDHGSLDVGIWRKIAQPNSRRFWFEAKMGSLTPRMSLKRALKAFETASADRTDQFRGREPTVLFMSEIKTRRVDRSPESLVARIWNECLGPTAIPFDAAARKAMIAAGCNHPELKRHIEAWLRMKRRASNW